MWKLFLLHIRLLLAKHWSGYFLSGQHSFFLFLIALHFLLQNHLSTAEGNFVVPLNQDTCPHTPEAEANPIPRGCNLPLLPDGALSQEADRQSKILLEFNHSSSCLFHILFFYPLAFPHPSNFLSD